VVENNCLYRKTTNKKGEEIYQYIVPEPNRYELMKRMHDTIWNGHLGVDKTSQKLRVRFFWPYQDKDVREYIKKCDVCAMIKEPQAYFRAELKPIKPARVFRVAKPRSTHSRKLLSFSILSSRWF
jgi:hypothetical protein